MGLFAKGHVVVIPYPFSDLSQSKLRPALVLAEVSGDDYILCQITSRPYTTRTLVEIDTNANPNSGLRLNSFARPEKLFTAHATIIREHIGSLEKKTVRSVIQEVVRIITG